MWAKSYLRLILLGQAQSKRATKCSPDWSEVTATSRTNLWWVMFRIEDAVAENTGKILDFPQEEAANLLQWDHFPESFALCRDMASWWQPPSWFFHIDHSPHLTPGLSQTLLCPLCLQSLLITRSVKLTLPSQPLDAFWPRLPKRLSYVNELAA